MQRVVCARLKEHVALDRSSWSLKSVRNRFYKMHMQNVQRLVSVLLILNKNELVPMIRWINLN